MFLGQEMVQNCDCEYFKSERNADKLRSDPVSRTPCSARAARCPLHVLPDQGRRPGHGADNRVEERRLSARRGEMRQEIGNKFPCFSQRAWLCPVQS
ncbi:hypothetical protein BaRGS_00010478 [Batillaria attramentaria]|uniref:Uncharacterized protein n=1 Tax=Batillaria attramentaria TaxID=370345 RepID=A0ABD0LFM3_9CAEN